MVAAEMRTLAERSAALARDIKASIGNTVAGIQSGVARADAALGSMDEVVASIARVSSLIREIASASDEQARGVRETSQAISRLGEVTQQNAALVEEAAAAAASFEDTASQMLAVVDAFKIDRTADRERAIALVKRAAAHLRHVGAERACLDFGDRSGGFFEGQLFIFAYSDRGVGLAHPGIPGYPGRDVLQERDADNKAFTQEALAMLKERGTGWIDYRIQNPVTHRVEAKSSYHELVNGVVLGCGIYKNDGVQSPANTMPKAMRRQLARHGMQTLPDHARN